MGFRKASLLLYFLFFLHHSFHAISPSTARLASADSKHDNLPVQSVVSKPDDDAFPGKRAELAFVVHKGGGGGGARGGGGGARGGGGRSFGGGGRSFGGGGRGKGGGERGEGGRGIGGRGVVPFVGGAAGGSHHGGHRSSGVRETARVWLGLSTLFGLVVGF